MRCHHLVLPPLVFLCFAADARAEDMVAVDHASVARYVESCRKPNGAFGPLDQEYTDAAWNYPALRTLELLGQEVKQPQAILEHGLGFPKGHGGYGHWRFFHEQRIRSLLDAKSLWDGREVSIIFQGYKPMYYGSPFNKKKKEELGYYNLSSLHYLLAGLEAARAKPKDAAALIAFIKQRQAPGGGFVDVRVEGREPTDREAHVAHTFHALAALKFLGGKADRPKDCVAFIKACQGSAGAYRWNPDDALAGNEDDVYYTWAAVQSLKLLGEKLPRAEKSMSWLNDLQNADGGFGDKPGWRSRLYSTYYAVHALRLLADHPTRGITAKQRKVPKLSSIPEGRFQVYQAIFKTPVVTSAELDQLRKRGVNLLAIKSADFEVAQALRAAIKKKKLPMDVILCPEEYAQRTERHGGAVLDHILNATLDPRWDAKQRQEWASARNTGQPGGMPWQEYQERVLLPLRKLGCLTYPEHEFEMEYGYSAYDAGVAGTGGYNAVLTGFNWPPRDFVRVFPWRERYARKLTPISDVDAHGTLEKWSKELDHTRNLFIARGPTYADFLEAAANGRVVSVIAEPEGVPSGVSYYGPQAAVEYVKKRRADWQWWTTPDAPSK